MAYSDEQEQQRVAAYVDGELSDEARDAFERAMAEDEALRDEVAAQRALRERIAGHYAPVKDEPIPNRLYTIVANGNEAQIIDFASAKARRAEKRRLPGWGNFTAIAATLAVGVIAGQMADLSPGPVASRDGRLFAQAGLERALDVQLASAQPADAKVRIGVTFREPRGAICRSFDSAALAGIACRTGGDWQLRQTVAPDARAATGDYRQAASGGAAVMQAAQAMMAGDPLDAAAERKAREAGWR